MSVPAIKVMLWTEDPMAPVPSWINEPVLVSKVNPVGNAGWMDVVKFNPSTNGEMR